MPSISGDDRRVRLCRAFLTTLKLLNSPVEDLALSLFALAIASIQMLGQTSGFVFPFGFKQFNDGPRGIHPPRCVNPGPDAKAQIVSGHLAVVAATGNINQRAQSG